MLLLFVFVLICILIPVCISKKIVPILIFGLIFILFVPFSGIYISNCIKERNENTQIITSEIEVTKIERMSKTKYGADYVIDYIDSKGDAKEDYIYTSDIVLTDEDIAYCNTKVTITDKPLFNFLLWPLTPGSVLDETYYIPKDLFANEAFSNNFIDERN